jgi:putative oxidoreductase
MKYIAQIPIYLIAFLFLFSASVYFFHFIPTPPMEGDAGVFAGLLFTTGFMTVVKVLETIFAIMLLYKPTKALALLLIAPIIINIFLFEILIAHKPGIGIVMIALNAFAIYQNRHKYWSIIAKDAPSN